MESELQRWLFFCFLFLTSAISSRPVWRDRKGMQIPLYAVYFFCMFFVAIYALARIFEPESLVHLSMPRDGFLWWTAAAATAGTFGGSLFGRWARRVTAGWNPDPGDVRYRLAERAAPDRVAAKQDGDAAD